MAIDNSEEIKRKIVETIRKHPEGLTIEALSKTLGMHRQTVTKYVLELKGAGVIIRRRVGSATLHYLKERFVQRVLEERIIERLKKKL